MFFDGFYSMLSQNLFRCNLRCFVAKPVLAQFTRFLCGEKLSPRFCPWRKNDKYHVCLVWRHLHTLLGSHPSEHFGTCAYKHIIFGFYSQSRVYPYNQQRYHVATHQHLRAPARTNQHLPSHLHTETLKQGVVMSTFKNTHHDWASRIPWSSGRQR